MPRPSRSLCLSISIVLALASTTAAQRKDVIPHAQDKPPGPALSPAEAIAKMTVHEGFKVELVASEPDIVNPVAMTIDERGRFWITESLEYPRREPGPGRDRVKILEDTNGDGAADKFTVFLDGLNIPSGVAVGHGGVWIANSPDILFVPDADRDGKPDGPPRVVVTGFGRSDTHELPNSLTWGPDGWLYGLNGVFNPCKVTYPKDSPWLKDVGRALLPVPNGGTAAGESKGTGKSAHPTEFNFTCAMFRIHPRTWEFQVFAEGTSNPWGIAFDSEGSAFVSACVIDHLWHIVETGYYHRQGGPYPPFTWKIDSIVKHKHQKAAYCGIHWFDSDTYPEKYREKLYMGNIHGGCINVDKLQRDGSTYFATPEPDFLTANDAWFMPVVQKTGPDGCLYILDWYDRYHCYQDANRDPAGIDRLKGRLYRVRYKDSPRALKFDLAKETDEQLIELLGNPIVFIRETAQRLLQERDIRNQSSKLMALINDPKTSTKMRRHAAFVMLSKPQLDSEILEVHPTQGFARDVVLEAWRVRQMFENPELRQIIKDAGSVTEWSKQLRAEPLPVMLQSIIGISKLPHTRGVFHAWMSAHASSGDDKLLPHIVWQNMHPRLEEHTDDFLAVLQEGEYLKQKHVANLMPRVTERLLGRKDPDPKPVVELFQLLESRDVSAARQCLAVVASRIQSGEIRGERLDLLKQHLQPELAKFVKSGAAHPLGLDAALLAVTWKDATALGYVRQTWTTAGLAPELRLQALRALVAAGDGQILDSVSTALTDKPRPSPVQPTMSATEFRAQVLAALSPLDQPRVADVVLQAYPHLEPDVQPKAIELLTQRASWAKRLLPRLTPAPASGGREAPEKDTIPAAAINLNQARRLLDTGDKEIAALVEKHWGSVRSAPNADRAKMIAEFKQTLRTTPGDPFAGEKAFKKVCAQCHKIYGEGADVGPDVTSNGRNDFNQLLSNVFDPSLVIGAGYRSYTVATQDGRVLNGLLVEESQQRIVLKVQGGKLETIPRADIDVFKVSEISMMPEQLEKQLTPQEIIDLFAFLILDKHPSDKSAKRLPGAN
jgi:putative membrane-bound dehydrogenase-like protein